MKTENKIGWNQLLAKFIELEENNFSEYLWDKIHIRNKNDLDFHKDWNWLMKVIEKIEKLGYWTKIHSLNNGSVHSFFIGKTGDSAILVQSLNVRDKKINVVYNSCVEFVKWHNKNKK